MAERRDRMNKRSAYWDNLKLLLVTLVVIGHFIDPLTENWFARSIFLFIYTFHVPLFLFVSGVFYSERRLRFKVLFYVCTGFLMKILNALTDLVIRQRTPEFNFFGDAGAPWYMFVLAAFLVLRWMLRDQNKRFFLIGWTLLACFAGYDRFLGDTLYLSRIIVFFPFYLAGSLIDRDSFPEKIKKHKFAWLAAAGALLALAWVCRFQIRAVYIYRHLLTGRNPFSNTVLPYGALARLGCYLVSAAAGLSVMVLTPKRRLPLLSSGGQNTLSVFVWHKPFYYLLERFTSIGGWFFLGPGGAAAYLAVAVALSLLLASVRLFSIPLERLREMRGQKAE